MSPFDVVFDKILTPIDVLMAQTPVCALLCALPPAPALDGVSVAPLAIFVLEMDNKDGLLTCGGIDSLGLSGTGLFVVACFM